jgi:hypothetical protein
VASENDLKSARMLAEVAHVGIVRIRGENPGAQSITERAKSRLYGRLERQLGIK